MTTIETIAVVGAGAWGTALAINAARPGRRVILWGRDADAMRVMASSRENAHYLPGIRLDPTIRITADLAETADADAILLVVPAQTVGEVAGALGQGRQPLAVCAKGLEQRATGGCRKSFGKRPLAVLWPRCRDRILRGRWRSVCPRPPRSPVPMRPLAGCWRHPSVIRNLGSIGPTI